MADEYGNRPGKVYPTPTSSAIYRAQAHLVMADKLAELARTSHGPRAYMAVIEGEAARHRKMVRDFRARYGPNAHL